MTAGLPRSDLSGASLYIINLSSSATPMALDAPSAPELAGLAVFRSRRIEDGRDRYRLHLGYFDSQEQAENVLPLVRQKYPAAWVALAPTDSMGSLDDTNVAQFKFIPQQKAPRTPAAAQTAASASVAFAQAPSLQLVESPPKAPVEPPILPPTDVLTLLESSPRVTPATFATEQAASPVEPIALHANQRFAVQLVWSEDRVDTAQIPQLDIFDAYTLYTVQVQRAGRRWYGLRLGFFSDPISARQVSLYARTCFVAAAVVPVSDRESDRATEAALASLRKTAEQAVPTGQKPAQTPKPVTRSLTGPIRGPLRGLDQKKPAARPDKNGKAEHSADDLLEELDASEVGFNTQSDPLNDTGVRHLSVSVVKRKSAGKRSSVFGR